MSKKSKYKKTNKIITKYNGEPIDEKFCDGVEEGLTEAIDACFSTMYYVNRRKWGKERDEIENAINRIITKLEDGIRNNPAGMNREFIERTQKQ